MPSTKDIVIGKALKIQLNGKPGAGKTGMAGSFHKHGPMRVFDFDNKLGIIKSLYPEIDIRYDNYGSDNFQNFMSDWESLQDKCPWKVILVDSLTTLSNTCVVYQLLVKGKMGKTTKGGVQTSGYDEINGETAIITKMLEIMNVINKKFEATVILTTHPVAKIEGTGENAVKTTSIAAYGFKVPSLVPSYFDEIYHVKVDRIGLNTLRRKILTFPSHDQMLLDARV